MSEAPIVSDDSLGTINEPANEATKSPDPEHLDGNRCASSVCDPASCYEAQLAQ